jgi:hypothetical protein
VTACTGQPDFRSTFIKTDHPPRAGEWGTAVTERAAAQALDALGSLVNFCIRFNTT